MNTMECSKHYGLTNSLFCKKEINQDTNSLFKGHIVERNCPKSERPLMFPVCIHTDIPKGERKHLVFSEQNNQLKVSVVAPNIITHKVNGKYLESLFSKSYVPNNQNPWHKVGAKIKTFDVKIPECMQGYLIDKGKWLNSSVISGNELLESASTGSGNVFGNNGLYVVGDEDFKYPVFSFDEFNSDKELKSLFDGVVLFKHDHLSPEISFPADGVGITYCFDNYQNKYISEFVLNPDKANGAFVERHPFPHIFTPENKDSTGVIVVGKEMDNGFYFCAIKLKFGEALYLSENVIHSDSSSIGELFVAFTEGVHSDTVLLKDHKCGIVNPY